MTITSLLAIGAFAASLFIFSFALRARAELNAGRWDSESGALLLLAICTGLLQLIELLPIFFHRARFSQSLPHLQSTLWICLGSVSLYYIYKKLARATDLYLKSSLFLSSIGIIYFVVIPLTTQAASWNEPRWQALLVPGVSWLFGVYLLYENFLRSEQRNGRWIPTLIALGSPTALLISAAVVLVATVFSWASPPNIPSAPSVFSLFCLFGFFSLYQRILIAMPMPDAALDLFNNLSVGVILADTSENIVQVNPVASQFIGVPALDAIGQSITTFGLGSPKRKRKRTKEILVEAPSGSGLFQVTHSVLEKQEQKFGTLVMLRDVSSQRKIAADLKSTHDALHIVAESKTDAPPAAIDNGSVFSLARGIAHDFNNLLSAIMGFATAARGDLPEGSHHKEDMEEILAAAEKARQIVAQLLTFGHAEKHKQEPIDANQVVESICQLLAVSLPENITIRSNICPEKISVLGDAMGLTKALMYFSTATYESMKETGSTLELSTEKIDLAHNFTSQHPPLLPGSHARFEISSDGPEPRELVEETSKIIENFFSGKVRNSKEKMDLIGILSSIEKHRGTVVRTPRSNKGTSIFVYLPAIVEHARGTDLETLGIPKGEGRILLVDDEDQLTRLGRRILEPLGYNVTAVTNSLEARRIFLEHPDEFDIVITDQTMPSMSGVELAEAILAVRRNIPIILLSGHTEQDIPAKAGNIGIKRFIAKPLSKHKLERAVRELLIEHSSQKQ